MGGKVNISLCMIAKDEEQWIANCIESVRAIVSEIILVDTGSRDRTIEIAKSYGAKVFHRPWDGDFSAPRNLSLEKATGDWILVLDADEAIDECDHQQLLALTCYPMNCYKMAQRHYSSDHRISNYKPVVGEYPEREQKYPGYFESSLSRFFPNKRGIHYIGRVHELVEHSVAKIPDMQVVDCVVPIHHYGHTQGVKQHKDKPTLYNALGAEKIAENPTDWKSYFELAVARNNDGRQAESVELFLRAIELKPEYVMSWINLGYVLCELARYPEAVQALETAVELDPQAEEAFCNLAVVYMRQKSYSRAVAYLERAIQLKPDYLNAYCNLGKSYFHLRQFERAIDAYQRALKVMPRSAVVKAQLGAIYLSLGRIKEAEQCLTEAREDDPALDVVHYYLAKVYQGLDDAKAALSALENFCELRPECDDPFVTSVYQERNRMREQLALPK